ncbi:STAS domain-containing protein [Nonomuraea sp. NPDC002799]
MVKVDTFRLLANLKGETFVLHPIGELDLTSAEQITQWLSAYLRDGPASITLVDLADVNFIDSVGLGALIQLSTRVSAAGHTVVFAAPARQPARLLSLTGLSQRLRVYETVAEAFAATTGKPAGRHTLPVPQR